MLLLLVHPFFFSCLPSLDSQIPAGSRRLLQGMDPPMLPNSKADGQHLTQTVDAERKTARSNCERWKKKKSIAAS